MPRQSSLSGVTPNDPHVIWQWQHLEDSSWSLTPQDLQNCFGTASSSRRFLVKLNDFARANTLAWPHALNLIEQEQIARRTHQEGSRSRGVSAKIEWSSTDIVRAMARSEPQSQSTKVALADKDVNGGITNYQTRKTKATSRITRRIQRADEVDEEEDEEEDGREETVESQGNGAKEDEQEGGRENEGETTVESHVDEAIEDERENGRENGGETTVVGHVDEAIEDEQEDGRENEGETTVESRDDEEEGASELTEHQDLDQSDFLLHHVQESPTKEKTRNCKRPQSQLDHADNGGTASLKKLESSSDIPDIPSMQDQPLSCYFSKVFTNVEELVIARLDEQIGQIRLIDNSLSTLRRTVTSLRSEIEAAKAQVRDSKTRTENLKELIGNWVGFDDGSEAVQALKRQVHETTATHERSQEEAQCECDAAEEEIRNAEGQRRELEIGVSQTKAWWQKSKAALFPLPSALDLGCEA